MGCFYTGHIKGEPDSQVAVSLCNGMVSKTLLFVVILIICPTWYAKHSFAQPKVFSIIFVRRAHSMRKTQFYMIKNFLSHSFCDETVSM